MFDRGFRFRIVPFIVLTVLAGAPAAAQDGEPPITDLENHVYLVPAAAHAPGAYGSTWRTDLVVCNGPLAPADADFFFMPSGMDNTGQTGKTVPVGADGCVGLTDVVAYLFNARGAGALLVGSDVPLRVSSRTYNSAAGGTYGQRIPAEAETDLLGPGERGWMVGLHGNANYRTNLGFASLSALPTMVFATLHDSSGSELGTLSAELPPYGHVQLDDAFGAVGAVAVAFGYATVASGDPWARCAAYASVIDNRTGDAVFIPAER
jgi:hypothetical protein